MKSGGKMFFFRPEKNNGLNMGILVGSTWGIQWAQYGDFSWLNLRNTMGSIWGFWLAQPEEYNGLNIGITVGST